MRPEVFRVDGSAGDCVRGTVRWAPAKSLWINGCLLGFVCLAPWHTTPGSVAMCAALTYLTLLLGHSVGMHRKLIHRTYQCPRWLERILVYLGVLVGMGGPFDMLRIHDVRNWAQREPQCHDFFSHRRSFWRDAMWQLNARFEFVTPPVFVIEDDIRLDPFYRWLQHTWMLQQIPLAVILYAMGGWSWVVWGVFGRVFVSVAGHWTVTYLTHNPGPRALAGTGRRSAGIKFARYGASYARRVLTQQSSRVSRVSAYRPRAGRGRPRLVGAARARKTGPCLGCWSAPPCR